MIAVTLVPIGGQGACLHCTLENNHPLGSTPGVRKVFNGKNLCVLLQTNMADKRGSFLKPHTILS